MILGTDASPSPPQRPRASTWRRKATAAISLGACVILCRAPSPRPAGRIEGLWLGGFRNSRVKPLVGTSMRQWTSSHQSTGGSRVNNLLRLRNDRFFRHFLQDG